MAKQYESEEDTKLRYITPALQKAGWSASKMLMEYSLKADRFKIVPGKNATVKIPPTGRNKPDYILCKSVNMPLAVVEAKSTAKIAEDGIDQAVTYAHMLDIPFAYASAGDRFLERNLMTGEQRELSMDDFPSPEELWKRWCEIRGVKDERVKNLDDALYYTSDSGKGPRYYQMVAINKTVNAVIADNRKRLLLVMATGTGKTFCAFQIVWRLKKAGMARRVLYLADRNQLVDQTIIGDFHPFEKIQTKIRNKDIDKNYSVFFGLYQQLKGQEGENSEGESLADCYKKVPRDFFDLIIVDECHRGSASEESAWRDILDYFSPAVQIGLTATPNHKEGSDNTEYFGEPIYTYSLKQGIEDGFLAPYQVVRVMLDKDSTGWEPEEGEVDDNGLPIPKRKYTIDDFDRTLILRKRTQRVAEKVTEYLHHLGRMSKTIIFCTTTRHAAEMRDAIRACNQDLVAKEPFYAVRMTGNDEEGVSLYNDFTSPYERYPVVVTTSKLLTTGADTKCVKLIVLDTNIRSMTEFKQIIGRGTRLREDADKTFFTILDFRGACNLFKDKEFDGDADVESEWGDEDPAPVGPKGDTIIDVNEGEDPKDVKGHDGKDGHDTGTGGGEVDVDPPEPPERYVVGDVEVTVVGTSVSYLDDDGNLVTSKFKDYTRKNILELFKSKAKFIEVWNGSDEKKRIIDELAEHGILIEHLKKEMGNPDYDEFDLILSVAFGGTPMTRQMRSSRAKRSEFLDKYQGLAREVLTVLLDIYAHEGVREIEDLTVLRDESFRAFGGMPKIVKAFGGKPSYLEAVAQLEKALYSENKVQNNVIY